VVPAIALLLLTIHAPKVPYILEYSCDSGWGDLKEDVCQETENRQDCAQVIFDGYSAVCIDGKAIYETAQRSFRTRQQAIDWIDSNFMYWPVKLMHGQTELTCQVKYLDSDSLDIWRAHQKEVDCDTRENLEKRNGKD
jgi:hypothetical protein